MRSFAKTQDGQPGPFPRGVSAVAVDRGVQERPGPAGPSHRTQTGICQSWEEEPVEPEGRKRRCVTARVGTTSVTPPGQRSSAVTSGTPGWSRKLENAGAMS